MDKDKDRASWEQADILQSASEASGARKHLTPPSLNPTNMSCEIIDQIWRSAERTETATRNEEN